MRLRDAAAALCFLAAPALAQDAGQERFGNWLHSCEGGPCQGYFSLKHPETGEAAISLGLLRDVENESATMIVVLPEMTALRPGISLRLGETEPVQAQFEFCNDTGCTAFAQLEAAQIAALLQEVETEVLFFQYGQSAPTSYTLPIAGVADLFDRLGRE